MNWTRGRLGLLALLPASALLLGAQAPDSSRALSTDDTLTSSAAATSAPVARFDGPALQLRADLSARELYVIENGNIVASYPVAIGKDAHPTPKGAFSVRKLVWNPGWVPPDSRWARNKTAKAPGQKGNPMKVVKIFFKEPDYYIHGTGDVESLGKKASHGCLRMSPSDAAEVGRWVMEHGGKPKEESWFRRILNFRSKSQTVYLSNPIRLTVTG